MTIIIFILVLLVTVTVHEWGHFFAARKSGMRVEEFGFGIPPKLWSKQVGETKYSINALPIGGFVKISGENGIDESVPLSVQFDTKPWYLKSFVLVAGVTMNIVLAIVLFTIANMIGMPTITDTGVPTVITVSQNSPASETGISVGDKVTKITANNIDIPTADTEMLRKAILDGAPTVTIDYIRGGEDKQVTITPKEKESGRYIGIGIEKIGIVKMGVWTACKSALVQTWNLIGSILHTLGSLLAGIFTHNGSASGLMGPVGLAREVGSAATIGFAYLLAFTAAISINLAVLNIMPFPALDGGRLIVVILEAITRRRFSSNTVGLIHTIGFLVLLGLMVVLTIGDISKFF
jgi:regulator of sigma E protease